MEMMEVAKMAASCERTKQEITSPSDVEAHTSSMVPRNNAHSEPFSGTPNQSSIISSITAKFTAPTAIYGNCLPIRYCAALAGDA